jgi:hypothetical protein
VLGHVTVMTDFVFIVLMCGLHRQRGECLFIRVQINNNN